VMSVVREGLSWTVLGIGLGGLTAGGLAQVMRGWLFAVAPWDPVAFGGGALLLVAVTLAACILPASRAAGTDPAAVLRGD
jgi:putative ABC transport system permease protein